MMPLVIPPVGDGAYQIERSLLCDGNSSLNRTPPGAGDRRTWTFSCWVKRSLLDSGTTVYAFMGSFDGSTQFDYLAFYQDQLLFYFGNGAGQIETTQLFRDVGAWYHIVCTADTTQASSEQRLRLYVNGKRVTEFSAVTYPSQNAQTSRWNTAVVQYVADYYIGTAPAHNGYLADIHHVDGQSLTADDFGETNPATGQWVPKAYVGTYGANGFHLPFDNNASLITLGEDASGNSNNWTLTGFTTDDSVTDTPTDNFCVLNPFGNPNDPIWTLSEGNLAFSHAASVGNAAKMGVIGTVGFDLGQWYYEYTVGAVANDQVGISTPIVPGNFFGVERSVYGSSGSLSGAGSIAGTPTAYAAGDVIGVAFDLDVRSVEFFKNGVSQAMVTGIAPETFFPFRATSSSASAGGGTFNFGQRPFAHTPPAGFNPLSTKNLPDPLIINPKQHFDTLLYGGTGAAQSIDGAEFQPDLVWLKSRNIANVHQLYDGIRGATERLIPGVTNAEDTAAQGLISFDAGGFSVGTDPGINTLDDDLVAWCWRAGVTPGFEIVTYTGDGVAGRTVAHGLGDVPAMMIVKSRTIADSWAVYHRDNTSAPETDVLFLNSSGGTADSTAYWNDTSPGLSSVTLGSNGSVNGNFENYIAYLFAEVPGFSRFGTYLGNASLDGPFVWCGFRPAFVLFKRADGPNDWRIYDSKRNTSNPLTETIYPNLTNAETTEAAVDFLSNGFKVRHNGTAINSGNFIFAAFAEHPFKHANAR